MRYLLLTAVLLTACFPATSAQPTPTPPPSPAPQPAPTPAPVPTPGPIPGYVAFLAPDHAKVQVGAYYHFGVQYTGTGGFDEFIILATNNPDLVLDRVRLNGDTAATVYATAPTVPGTYTYPIQAGVQTLTFTLTVIPAEPVPTPAPSPVPAPVPTPVPAEPPVTIPGPTYDTWTYMPCRDAAVSASVTLTPVSNGFVTLRALTSGVLFGPTGGDGQPSPAQSLVVAMDQGRDYHFQIGTFYRVWTPLDRQWHRLWPDFC